MKRLISFILVLLFMPFMAVGQWNSSDTRTIQLQKDGSLIEISLQVKKKKVVEPKRNRFYHWFAFDQVQVNEGAYSGLLLHGLYRVYDPSGRLIEQGLFEEGQKTGSWFKWDSDGNILNETEWNNSLKNGQSLTYAQGELIKEERFKHNVLHGNTIHYYADGSKETFKYRHGELVVRAPKEKKMKTFFKGVFRKVFKSKDKDKIILEEEESSEMQEW